MVGLLAFSPADSVSPTTIGTTRANVPPSSGARFTCFIIVLPLPQLPFLDVSLPGTLDAALNRLVGRALLRVTRQQPVNFLSASCGNLEAVVQTNPGYPHHAVHIFDVTLDLGHE